MRGAVTGANEANAHFTPVSTRSATSRRVRSRRFASRGQRRSLSALRRGQAARAIAASKSAKFFISVLSTARKWARPISTPKVEAAHRDGLLRHRHQPYGGCRHRAEPRCQRHYLAGVHRAFSGAGAADQFQRRETASDAAEKLYRELATGPASKSCSTTATSAPVSSLRTPILIGIPLRVTIGAKGLDKGYNPAAHPPRRRQDRRSGARATRSQTILIDHCSGGSGINDDLEARAGT